MRQREKKSLPRNVTISGLPGAGSTTLGQALATTIKWQFFSGGDFMRRYAIKQGWFDKENKLHHPATAYGGDFDRHVDFGMREDMEAGNHKIFESWLSGFMAQGVSGVLKILVFCSDDAVRIDRIVNRDKVSIGEAKKHIFAREQKNAAKWQKLYHQEWEEWVVKKKVLPSSAQIDFWHPKLYDLTIDTYSHSREETLSEALRALGYA